MNILIIIIWSPNFWGKEDRHENVKCSIKYLPIRADGVYFLRMWPLFRLWNVKIFSTILTVNCTRKLVMQIAGGKFPRFWPLFNHNLNRTKVTELSCAKKELHRRTASFWDSQFNSDNIDLIWIELLCN